MKKIVLALGLCMTANLAVGCAAKEDDEPAVPAVTKKDGGAPVVGGAGALSAATPVKGCTAYPTVGDMDKLFVKTCGDDSSCHKAKIPYGDLKTADIWKRMKDVTPALVCTDGKLIDSQKPEASILLMKLKQPVPACPPGTGKEAGLTMPPMLKDQLQATKYPALTPDELKCLEGFVAAIAAAK